jgi:hypothetical protein
MSNKYLLVFRFFIFAVFLVFVLSFNSYNPGSNSDNLGILYSQNELVTHPGGGYGGADASIVQPPGTLRGSNVVHGSFRICDDFTVPVGYNWLIDSIWIYAYQNGSGTSSTINFVSMKIWNGVPNQTGSVGVFGDTATNRMTRTVFSNIYRSKQDSLLSNFRPIMKQTVNINHTLFNPGTYWLDWSVNGTSTSGPWSPPRSIWGTGNTGNSKQRVSYVWTDIIDSGFAKGQAFVIYGTAVPVTGIGNNTTGVDFELKQNFPNPFNPFTVIPISINKPSDVKLIIYDNLGKEIAVLIDKHLEAGEYNIKWDASGFNSGIYFYRLQSGNFIETKKMLLIK